MKVKRMLGWMAVACLAAAHGAVATPGAPARQSGAGEPPEAEVERPDPLADFRADADAIAAEAVPGEGLRRVVALAEEGELGLSLALVEALSEPHRFDLLPEPERATLDFARGRLVLLREPDLLGLDEPFAPLEGDALEALGEVRRAFARARAGSGPGLVRERAVMALGTLDLHQAERGFRAFVTELQQGGGAPPAAPAGEEEPPDPIERAKALIEEFEGARDLLVERVRIAWLDPDPRANLEWAQRRIRELEQIVEELERQEEEQEDPQAQDQEQPQEGDEGDDSSESQGEDPSEEDGESDSEQDQGADSEEGPEDEGPDEAGPDEEGPDEEGPEEEGTEEEGPENPSDEEQSPAEDETDGAAAESEPQSLSPEEIADLLNRLEQLEQQAEEDRERRRLRGRRTVERDW